MKNFIKSVVLIALGTLTVYGSGKGNVDKMYLIEPSQFKEFLQTGKLEEANFKDLLKKKNKKAHKHAPKCDKLSLFIDKSDITLYLKNEGGTDKKYVGDCYQPIKIHNNFLLIDKNLVDSSKKPKGIISEYAPGFFYDRVRDLSNSLLSYAMNGLEYMCEISCNTLFLLSIVESGEKEGVNSDISSVNGLSVLMKKQAEENLSKIDFNFFPQYPVIFQRFNEPLLLSGSTGIIKEEFCQLKVLVEKAIDPESLFSNISKGAASQDTESQDTESLFGILKPLINDYLRKPLQSLSDRVWEHCIRVPENYKIASNSKFGIFPQGGTLENYLKFNQDKEDFFTFLHVVNSSRSKPCLESEFFDLVYNMGKELDAAFPQLNIKDDDWATKTYQINHKVYEGINSKSPITAKKFAKTALLNTLFHPDPWAYPKFGNNVFDNKNIIIRPELTREVLPFVPNYGQAVRWLKHINPDDEYSHIYTSEEYKNVKLGSIKKSFWVLKNGYHPIDLYRALLFKVAFGQFMLTVHDVSINKRNSCNNIVVEVEYGKLDTYLDRVVETMQAFDRKRKMVEANGIRFIIRDSGYFELVTAFPIFIDPMYSSKIGPTRFIEFNFTPKESKFTSYSNLEVKSVFSFVIVPTSLSKGDSKSSINIDSPKIGTTASSKGGSKSSIKIDSPKIGTTASSKGGSKSSIKIDTTKIGTTSPSKGGSKSSIKIDTTKIAPTASSKGGSKSSINIGSPKIEAPSFTKKIEDTGSMIDQDILGAFVDLEKFPNLKKNAQIAIMLEAQNGETVVVTKDFIGTLKKEACK